MSDFETHPAGTADLVKRLLANGLDECDEAATRIEQLELRANAATAAAYEVAANVADDYTKMRERQIAVAKAKATLHVDVPQVMRWQAGKIQSEAISEQIRALATPDQTAALDKLIAEAEARTVERIAEMVSGWRNTTPMTGEECAISILAASKKGGA